MPCTEKTVDIIRVIVWKTRHDDNNNVVDALADGYDYCKGVVEKGYKLCVQPARVEQYSDEEFISMVKLFETLNPMAIYIVDSWGTCQTEDIIHYMKLANDNMKSEIAIGYHGHNNMMQAFGTATALLHQKFNRDLIVDGSVYGMGRCAGNLNLEIFARYLNETENKNYELSPIYSIYEKYIKKIYEQHKWGYNIYYFLTAVYKCHPNYAFYLGLEKNIDLTEFEKVLTELSPEDKILYTRDKADFYYNLHAKGIT
jgi:4-hydroxy 2-oxovalerate aldolase